MTIKLSLLHLILVLNWISFAEEKREIELPDYWQITSTQLDSSIEKGFSKVKVVVKDKFLQTPLVGTKIFINTNHYVGQTDSLGIIEGYIPNGLNRFCADTKEGNSFIVNHHFVEQHAYEVNVFMNPYQQITDQGSDLYPVAEKPVIYLYPTKKQKVHVEVVPNQEFLFTYPKYPNEGWNVVAHPNGNLEYNNRNYRYLFWEGIYAPIINSKDDSGFIVDSDTVIDFLENTLTKVGLSHQEQADFITYWGPKLLENQLNFIHFYFNESCDKYISELNITPKPESLIRIFMTYQQVSEIYYIDQQDLPTFKRDGFTVVEWGGSYK